MGALIQAGTRMSGLPVVSSGGDLAQYLTFMLGGETYAIGILAIKEIIEYSGVTVVPMMPESVRGVINLRGAVVPVMDLSVRFGKPLTTQTKRTCVVIVEVASGGDEASQVVGVMVDAVNSVLEIAGTDIEAAPSFGARIDTRFIQGIGKVNGRFVILLNVDEVLALDETETFIEEAQANRALQVDLNQSHQQT